MRVPDLVGICNVTPDSFFDGGRDAGEAVDHGLRLADEGAAWVDVGGESTRPGAQAVADDVQCARVLPVIRALCAARPSLVVSVDTRSSTVAAAAFDAGASVVNDVSGLRSASMRQLVARSGVRAVVMHTRGEPANMAQQTSYVDVVAEVEAALRQAVDRALADGVQASQIIVDPGIGFAKRAEHNPPLVAATARLGAMGYPVLVGASRKRFIGELTGTPDPADRLAGSLAAAIAASLGGARYLRVHDVAATRQALTVFAACRP